MNGSAILTTAIGVAVLYALLSLVCSALNEWLSQIQRLRADILQSEIRQLLGTDLSAAFNAQALIAGMYESGRYPLYIPPSTFALVLIHIGFEYSPGQHGTPGTVALKEPWNCDQTAKQFARQILEGLRQDSTSLGSLQLRIEKWFELAMEQASGRYKRLIQIYVITFALGIVVLGNVDTIAICTGLYQGAVYNKSVVFPIGWWGSNSAAFDFVHFAGLFLSWAAISLGAPFWFDVLNKLVNLRSTGLPPDESAKGKAGSGLMAQ